MSSYLPFVFFFVVVVALLVLSARARRRQGAAEQQRVEEIVVGSEVMTTAGLYGTVVARNDDDSVLLAIAPGVEVRWAFAALRTIDSLPAQYRGEQRAGDPALGSRTAGIERDPGLGQV